MIEDGLESASSEVLADDEIDAGGSIEVMDPTGHFEIRWGKKKAEVELAEKQFKDLLSKGYLAFKKTWIGRKGKPAESFDPKERVYIIEMGPLTAEVRKQRGDPLEVEVVKKDDKPEASDGEKKLPALPAPSEKSVDKEGKDDEEFEHQQTREFDKKGKHTMTPPLRGG